VQSNDQIKLKEAAEYKIQAFIEMLGADARLLTEGEEIKSHDLFNRLTSRKTITGEDEDVESELKYLKIIRGIRDNELDLFENIKRLPKKARTARSYEGGSNALITYFRKGKLQKFYQTAGTSTKELDFLTAAKELEVARDTPRKTIGDDYHELLSANKEAFYQTTTEEIEPSLKMKGGRDSATFMLRVLKSNQVRYYKGYSEDDELYVQRITKLIEEGALPRQTTKTLVKEIEGKQIR
jgi:hypothetical protein